MGCDFCATTKTGFERNLTTGEIVDRVIYTLGERTRNDGVRRVPLILAGR